VNRFWHGRNGTLLLVLYFSFLDVAGDGVLILTTTIRYDVIDGLTMPVGLRVVLRQTRE